VEAKLFASRRDRELAGAGEVMDLLAGGEDDVAGVEHEPVVCGGGQPSRLVMRVRVRATRDTGGCSPSDLIRARFLEGFIRRTQKPSLGVKQMNVLHCSH
jgi:hypothetical protein